MQVSIREFQLHAGKYLRELPIVLTQYNLPIASVVPYTVNTSVDTSVTQPQDNTLIPTSNLQYQIDATKEIIEDTPELKPMCDMPFCKQRSEGHYRITTDAGENTKDYNLCVFHWNKARRESEVREI